MTALSKSLTQPISIRSAVSSNRSLLPTSSMSAIYYPFQKKCFYANGLWWIFYSDGTNFGWAVSSDGVMFSGLTAYGAYSSADIDVWYDQANNKICLARVTENSGDPVYYRQGTANADGSISWDSAEVNVYSAANCAFTKPKIVKDSSGYPWISFTCYNSGNSTYYFYVIQASATNGSSWPASPTALWTSSTDGTQLLVPLTSGKMFAIVYSWGLQGAFSQLYSGGSWGGSVTIVSGVNIVYPGSGTPQGYCMDAVADGDNVHWTYLAGGGPYAYRKYTYGSGWGGYITWTPSTSTGYASFMMNGPEPSVVLISSDYIRVFFGYGLELYGGYEYSIVAYRDRIAGVLQSEVDVATPYSFPNGPYGIVCSYQPNSNRYCLIWVDNPEGFSGYAVEFQPYIIPLTQTSLQSISIQSSAIKTPKPAPSQSVTIHTLRLPIATQKLAPQPIVITSQLSRSPMLFTRVFSQAVVTLGLAMPSLAGIHSIIRTTASTTLLAGRAGLKEYQRLYMEWPIGAIPSGVTITDVAFQYNGISQPVVDSVQIRGMKDQPSAQPDTDAGNETVYYDVEKGNLYYSGSSFPLVGSQQSVDLGSQAVADLQAAVNAGQSWFAIGVRTSESTIGDIASIYSAEYASADPKPTLLVTYTISGVAPFSGMYTAKMEQVLNNYLQQQLVAKVPTDLVQSISFYAKADTVALIQAVIQYDDYYSDTTIVNVTTSWVQYFCKFSPAKNIQTFTITFIGTSQPGKYLYLNEIVIEFHQLEITGKTDSYIQPFQEIDAAITRDANENASQIVLSSSTRTVTLAITRDAAGKIINITKTVT